MILDLATAMTAPPRHEDLAASNAVSIVPESKNLLIQVLLKGRLPSQKIERSGGLAVPGGPASTSGPNRFNLFSFFMVYK
jgi:hypothetical protein